MSFFTRRSWTTDFCNKYPVWLLNVQTFRFNVSIFNLRTNSWFPHFFCSAVLMDLRWIRIVWIQRLWIQLNGFFSTTEFMVWCRATLVLALLFALSSGSGPGLSLNQVKQTDQHVYMLIIYLSACCFFVYCQQNVRKWFHLEIKCNI